ncbi:MAG: Rieske 2Fe-2S domain-containing protein [Gammaproteobacteria bacterium]|nr:Rieske 2Fe-2S domain-containing protein [Gammaproteobacteria bacterium]
MPYRLDGHSQPDLPQSHYLDNRIYTDPVVFETEKKTILTDSWRFVCHASELQKAFDYRLVRVAGHELVLIKGEDETIRAFYNTCAHRGARLLRQPAGNLEGGRMTCFYHLWSFDNRGRCLTVSQPSGYKDSSVRRESTGLKEVRLDSVFDLVFVCLDDEAGSLRDFLGDSLIEAMRVPFGSASLEVFHLHRSEIQCNWKLFVETNCEGYHELLHLLNRNTAVSQQEYRSRQWRMHENGHLSFDPAKISYDKLDYAERAEGLLPGMEPNGHAVVNLFPDVMLNCRSTVIRIDSLIPVSPGKTILECRGLGVAGDSQSVRDMRIDHHNEVWGPTGVNLAEDIWAVQTQMQNMKEGSSRFSVIAREEEGPMSDGSLRNFYAEWSRITNLQPHHVEV